jgi:hypothetical protein
MIRQIRSTSHMAMAPEKVFANIEKSFERNLPRFWNYPEVGQFKGEAPLSIVAGGPSLNKTLHEIEGTVMVCGSAHDHLVSLMKPDYCVVCDPDAISANYLTTPVKGCVYLIASHCDDAVFEALEGFDVWVWHSGGMEEPEKAHKLFRGENRVGGGCTVTLRALSLGILLGYGNQHYFGFDSCVMGSEHHAYKSEDVGHIADVRMPGSNRTFWASGYMLAQAQQFQDAIRTQGHLFQPTVHGDGLIAEIMKVGAFNAATNAQGA